MDTDPSRRTSPIAQELAESAEVAPRRPVAQGLNRDELRRICANDFTGGNGGNREINPPGQPIELKRKIGKGFLNLSVSACQCVSVSEFAQELAESAEIQIQTWRADLRVRRAAKAECSTLRTCNMKTCNL